MNPLKMEVKPLLAKTISFFDCSFTNPNEYIKYVQNFFSIKDYEDKESILVLPGNLGLLLALLWGDIGEPKNYEEALKSYIKLPKSWFDKYIVTQKQLALNLSCYLVPGSLIINKNDRLFMSSFLLSPKGEVLGQQDQLYLSQDEKKLGLSRGDDVKVFTLDSQKLGIIIGTDAWYPEIGRILALKGVDIVCHCGVLPASYNIWRQIAGMWQQVQQNQFFCIESQLVTSIAGKSFKGLSILHGPCEITPGKKGIIAHGGFSRYPVEADLDIEQRTEFIKTYPLLKLLNPSAYENLNPAALTDPHCLE